MSDDTTSTSVGTSDALADAGDIDATVASDANAVVDATTADSTPASDANPLLAEADGAVVVDPGTPHQTIDGFGASDAFTPTGPLSAQEGTLFFDPVNGIGLSLLRVGIDVNGQGLGSATAADAQLAASYGAKVWAAPWSPDPSDKDNGTEDAGGHLCGEAGQGVCAGNDYDAWATALASFPAWLQAQAGVNVYAISAQNEPDWSAPYASCLYTATEMVNFAKVLGPKLAALNPPVKLMAAEPEQWSHLWGGLPDCSGINDYGVCIHADPVANAAVGIYAAHDYGLSPMPPPSWIDKPIWETEVSGLSGNSQAAANVDIGNGIAVANWVYNALVTGGASAWHYWWLVATPGATDNEGLLFAAGGGPDGGGDLNSPPKRFYTVGNFSKFVRPGYQRIDVPGSSVPSGVRVVAFQNPADLTLVVVAINTNTSSVPASFFVGGTSWPANMTPWVTSATENLAQIDEVPVGNARFSATLEAQSVTTFVGTP